MARSREHAPHVRPALDDGAVEQALRRRHRRAAYSTFPPPPDWPKMVTLPGSPPNAAMLSRTHSSAATISSMPTLLDRNIFPHRVGQVEIAEHVEAMVDGDDHHVLFGREIAAVVHLPVGRSRRNIRRRGTRPSRAACRLQAGRPDVQVQAVFAARPSLAVLRHRLRNQHRGNLRRAVPELERIPYARSRAAVWMAA